MNELLLRNYGGLVVNAQGLSSSARPTTAIARTSTRPTQIQQQQSQQHQTLLERRLSRRSPRLTNLPESTLLASRNVSQTFQNGANRAPTPPTNVRPSTSPIPPPKYSQPVGRPQSTYRRNSVAESTDSAEVERAMSTDMHQDNESSDVPSAKSPSSEEIVIHVYDESNNVNKDFVCPRDLLLREMKYFRAYLTDNCSTDDIDISVHCDVNIFQWLMDYIKGPEESLKLDASWAVSILISSYFLEMDRLVESSLDFVYKKMQQIIKLPIELDCLNNELLDRLSKMFSEEELENLKDRKDKIVSRLYMKKLETMLEKDENTICRCGSCGKLFTVEQMSKSKCHRAKVHFNYHGEAISHHEIDKKWNINKYLINLKRNMSWREIYWKCWGLIHSFYCTRCGTEFAAAEYGHCSYHKQEPMFDRGSNIGFYPCCNTKALKFDSSGMVGKRGCCSRNHQVKDEENNPKLELLLKRHQEIMTPFRDPESEATLYTDDLAEEFDEFKEVEDEDEDEEENLEEIDMFPTCKKYSIFDSDAMFNSGKSRANAIDSAKIKKNRFEAIPTTKKRYTVMDTQRLEDRKNLYDISNMLAKRRVDSEREKRLEKKRQAKKKTAQKVGVKPKSAIPRKRSFR